MVWTEWSYKSSRGSGSDSWGLYDRRSAPPPVPNQQTDSAATIAADWAAWTTANAGAVNPMLQPALAVSVRANFSDADVGSPAPAGGAAYDNTAGRWTVWGGGSDIGGGADQFNFASKPAGGDLTAVALVGGVSGTDAGAKAGVMIRSDTGAGSAFAALVATPGGGVLFQWRAAAGDQAQSAQLAGLATPVWVKLTRSGNDFRGFASGDGVNWTQVGAAQTLGVSVTARAGLAVTAHTDTALASATFTQVSVMPAGWADGDVGATGLPGSAVFDPSTGTWTVAGGGSDIWGTADQFHLAAHPLTGDASLLARMTGVQSTDVWAKAGVMLRDSTAANAPFADVVVTPGQGVNFQWRSAAGGNPGGVAVAGITTPVWVKLTRTSNTFAGFYSVDGVTWTQIGSSQTLAISPTALAGLAVTAHNNGLLNTATFTMTSPAAVQSVVVDDGSVQRSMVRSVTVTFDRLVNFGGSPSAAFQLSRTGPGTTGNVTLAVDLSGSTTTQTIARLTFSGTLTEGPNSLVDGDYTLTVFNNQIQGGIQGGDNVSNLFRLFGDVNGDKAVNGLDLALFRTAFGTSLGNPNYVDYLDQNGDGTINGLDLAVFRTHFGTTLP
jgi:hypothetical protein